MTYWLSYLSHPDYLNDDVFVLVGRSPDKRVPAGVKPTPHHGDNVRVPPVRALLGPRLHGKPAAVQPEESYSAVQCRTNIPLDIFSHAGELYHFIFINISFIERSK